MTANKKRQTMILLLVVALATLSSTAGWAGPSRGSGLFDQIADRTGLLIPAAALVASLVSSRVDKRTADPRQAVIAGTKAFIATMVTGGGASRLVPVAGQAARRAARPATTVVARQLRRGRRR